MGVFHSILCHNFAEVVFQRADGDVYSWFSMEDQIQIRRDPIMPKPHI